MATVNFFDFAFFSCALAHFLLSSFRRLQCAPCILRRRTSWRESSLPACRGRAFTVYKLWQCASTRHNNSDNMQLMAEKVMTLHSWIVDCTAHFATSIGMSTSDRNFSTKQALVGILVLWIALFLLFTAIDEKGPAAVFQVLGGLFITVVLGRLFINNVLQVLCPAFRLFWRGV